MAGGAIDGLAHDSERHDDRQQEQENRYRLTAGPQVGADSTITFTLFVPGKQHVNLLGSFNGWSDQADPMQAGEGGLWRIEKQLPPGTHQYQFRIDDRLTICDPYAVAVIARPGSDVPAAVVEAGAEPYRWQHPGWTRPASNDLLIYELHVGDFSPEGTFQGVIDRLDHLVALGVNAIELMPVMEFAGGQQAWGYEPLFFFATHAAYGTREQLKALVDAAHGRGIAVILDIVLAHTAHEHPFGKLYPFEQSPWYGRGLGEQNQFGFPTLDYGKRAAAAFAKDVLTYWLCECRVDGYRFDYCLGIGAREGLGMPDLVAGARAVDQQVYLIAEYLPEEQGVLRCCTFDGAWHGRFKSAVWALLRQDDYRDFSYFRFREAIFTFDPRDEAYTDVTAAVNYFESHDEERLMCVLQREAGFEAEIAAIKAMLGATILMTIPGVPMIYQGQEWGEESDKLVNARNTLHWGRRNSEMGQRFMEHYRVLSALRRKHPALRGADMEFILIDRDKRVAVFRRAIEGDEVVVAANFSPLQREVEIHFPAAGAWHDPLGGDELAVEEWRAIRLPAYTARVYEHKG
jgi:1,4-alpha-glucan branching enzyme